MNAFYPVVLLSVTFCLLPGCGDKLVDCDPNQRKECLAGEIHWVDSCGIQGAKVADCNCGCNEDLTGCKEDCGCTPECSGKCCGDDGCQGECPDVCTTGSQTCNPTTCQCQDCMPGCDGKECGPDGCGGFCPPGCDDYDTCLPASGQCLACIPSCLGRCCGDDLCGGVCPDSCASTGQTCNPDSCLCEGDCTPDCVDKECGPDLCGDACGTCEDNQACLDGLCTCPNEVCGDACCLEGQICDNDSCCLADCTDRDCGADCAGMSCGLCPQGAFCQAGTFSCIIEGIESCFDGSQCAAESPYCLFSCRQQDSRCCTVQPDHPMQVNAQIDDSCEVCCSNPDYPHPVRWPDGEPACCASGAPYPYFTCLSGDNACCPRRPDPPRLCDGGLDTSCVLCCPESYPNPVRFPDGSPSCCSQNRPYPCVVNGNNNCCEQAGQCQ